jgi:carbonyl reductase 1
MTTQRTAIVTGGNRGIGLEVCRGLARAGVQVVLGARELAAGQEAARELAKSGLTVLPRKLDITLEEDRSAIAREARDAWGGIEILVNNAAIDLRGFDANVARTTTSVDYFATAILTDELSPIVNSGGTIVMVSSGLGALDGFSEEIRAQFSDPALTRERLDALVSSFVRAVEEGTHERQGWPSSAYGVSKLALNALTRLLAHDLAPRGVRVNSTCPGWVKTRMGGNSAPRTAAEGADTIVWAALLPSGGPSGRWFRDRSEIPW